MLPKQLQRGARRSPGMHRQREPRQRAMQTCSPLRKRGVRVSAPMLRALLVTAGQPRRMRPRLAASTMTQPRLVGSLQWPPPPRSWHRALSLQLGAPARWWKSRRRPSEQRPARRLPGPSQRWSSRAAPQTPSLRWGRRRAPRRMRRPSRRPSPRQSQLPPSRSLARRVQTRRPAARAPRPTRALVADPMTRLLPPLPMPATPIQVLLPSRSTSTRARWTGRASAAPARSRSPPRRPSPKLEQLPSTRPTLPRALTRWARPQTQRVLTHSSPRECLTSALLPLTRRMKSIQGALWRPLREAKARLPPTQRMHRPPCLLGACLSRMATPRKRRMARRRGKKSSRLPQLQLLRVTRQPPEMRLRSPSVPRARRSPASRSTARTSPALARPVPPPPRRPAAQAPPSASAPTCWSLLQRRGRSGRRMQGR
mmetsp:Transcript_57277/g.114808  ORF Transcript_57277/g.114808 Transcript_57277/m.114808 type:complete len:426 (-) Transcript_57277:596-1873(-)